MEITEAIHVNEATHPILAELSYDMDPQIIYDHLFGKDASGSETHQQNYQCLAGIVNDINLLVDGFIDNIEEILDIRISAALKGVPPEREKRAIGIATGVALTLGLANLGSQAVGAIFFNSRYEKLYNFIASINRQVQLDFDYSEKLNGNLRVLVNQTKKVGIRSNVLLLGLARVRRESACDLATTWKQFELNSISSFLNLVATDLAVGTATPRIFPARLVSQMNIQANLFQGTLLEGDPLLFYRETKLSILNFNRERRSVSVILAFPRIQNTASYVRINILNPTTLVPTKEGPKESYLELTSEVALPFKMVNDPKFNLKNLTTRMLQEARVPSECGTLSSTRYCRNFLPLGEREKRCMGELSRGEKSWPSCRITVQNSEHRNFVGVKRGVQGTVISAPDNVKIEGISGKVKAILHHARNDPSLGYCSFIPNHFSQIIISRGTNEITFNQTPLLMVYSPLRLKDKTWNYVDKQLYRRVMEGFERANDNMSGLDVDVRMETLSREIVPLDFSTETHISNTFFNYFIYAIVIGLCLLAWRWRRAIKRKISVLKNLGQEGDPSRNSTENDEEAPEESGQESQV